MGSGMQQHLLFFLSFAYFLRAGAYVMPCETFQGHYNNVFTSTPFVYLCVIPEEGFTNFDVLANIKITQEENDPTYDFAEVAKSTNSCIALPDPKKDFTVQLINQDYVKNECDQEFSIVRSNDVSSFIRPVKEVQEYTFQTNTLNTVGVPQTGMWFHKKSCVGDGSVKYSSGTDVENGHSNDFLLFPCESFPDWLISFDDFATIVTDSATLNVEYSSNINSRNASGRGDNLQNLIGADHRARMQISSTETVNFNMQTYFQDGGSIGLQKELGGPVFSYGGSHSELFKTQYFEVRYMPNGLQPNQIFDNDDHTWIEISIGGEEATTTVAPTSTSTTPISTVAATTTAPTSSPAQNSKNDAYCNCDVDKFGFPIDWNYNNIWLDIIVILDCSEAMGKTSLDDASSLIESFISDGINDFLITDTSSPLYTRVGVISMADTATILYNLNMTKADKVQGKVSIKQGVAEIDVIDALEAALSMFSDGLKKKPDRVNTRQVVYYMTDSNPEHNLDRANEFKEYGVIIVNDFPKKGEEAKAGLMYLASDGYYYSSENYMAELQTFCKANCFRNSDKTTYGGSDPAVQASGGCYRASAAGVPFNKAKTNCANDGGIIATVHDDDKGAFLNQLMDATSSKSDYFWIGYEKSDDGKWIWEDESTDPYTNWDTDEPSSAAVAKCAYEDITSPHFLWGAGNCQLGFPYVCQYPPCSVGNKNC